MSVGYWESHIFLLHVLEKEHKNRAVNCMTSAQTVLKKFQGQSFSGSMFSLSVSVSVSSDSLIIQTRGNEAHRLSRICRFYIGASSRSKVNCELTVIALLEHDVMQKIWRSLDLTRAPSWHL